MEGVGKGTFLSSPAPSSLTHLPFPHGSAVHWNCQDFTKQAVGGLSDSADGAPVASGELGSFATFGLSVSEGQASAVGPSVCSHRILTGEAQRMKLTWRNQTEEALKCCLSPRAILTLPASQPPSSSLPPTGRSSQVLAGPLLSRL